MQMDGTVHITIRVRKYLWKEFAYDVCYALYAIYMIANALFKRYLKHSIPELYMRMHAILVKFPVLMDDVYKNSILVILLVMFGIGGLVYTASIPIILFLVAIGRIR